MSKEIILNILIAYPFFNDSLLRYLRGKERSSYRLIVDSGAFSAWNSGKIINLDEYCRFLDLISFLRPFHAVQLDVFGDAEASYRNLCVMQSRGYDVMPVFTRGDNLERLEQYYQQTDYIMFGGIVIGGKNKNYVKWFLNKNKGRKCHWLGFVNMDFIKVYRPESVDSSSWKCCDMYGSLGIYAGKGEILRFERKDFSKKPSAKTIELCNNLGVNFDQMRNLSRKESWKGFVYDSSNWDTLRGSGQFITTLSHVARAVEVEKKLGTKIFMASQNKGQTRILFEAANYLQKHGRIIV